MLRIFRAVIFDLDGLLADSEPWWNQIDAKLLAEYGVTYRGEYHRDVLGVSYRLAIEFYKKALGAQENGRIMAPDGKAVMHAQLKIGNSMLMLGNEFQPHCLSPKSRGGTSVTLHLYLENADAAFERAVKAGCTAKMPMAASTKNST